MSNRTDYTVAKREYVVVLTTPPAWAVLDPGDVLSTRAQVVVLHGKRDDGLARYVEEGGSLDDVPDFPTAEERANLNTGI